MKAFASFKLSALLLFAAPAALLGCLFGMAGLGFLIGSAMALSMM